MISLTLQFRPLKLDKGLMGSATNCLIIIIVGFVRKWMKSVMLMLNYQVLLLFTLHLILIFRSLDNCITFVVFIDWHTTHVWHVSKSHDTLWHFFVHK